ncbi:Cytochrome P450, partial [Dillenia turbinata]
MVLNTIISGAKSISQDQPLVITISLVVLAIFSYFILNSFKQKARKPMPPSPFGLPLVGQLPFLDPELHSYFALLARTHGPILKLQLGQKIAIVISSPSLAKEVLKDKDVVFANRDVPAAATALAYGARDIVWNPYGPEWCMLRKVCVREMLSNTTLDAVYSLRRGELRRTIGYIYSRAGSPVNIGEQVFLTVLNVITSMLWGGTVKGEERAALGSDFRKAITEMTNLLGVPNISDFYPGLARFDLQGVLKKIRVQQLRFDEMFDGIIKQREKMEGGDESKDFLHFLLQLKDESDAKTPLTMTHVRALLMDMVVGGTDTTSNSMEFAMSEMMNKPEVMRKVQQELDEVVGGDNIVEESHLHQLPYLYAVMKEVLRLHPVLPLLVPHCPSIAMAERMFMYSLASLLHSFNWKLPDGEKMDLSEAFGITMKKKVPLTAIPTP